MGNVRIFASRENEQTRKQNQRCKNDVLAWVSASGARKNTQSNAPSSTPSSVLWSALSSVPLSALSSAPLSALSCAPSSAPSSLSGSFAFYFLSVAILVTNFGLTEKEEKGSVLNEKEKGSVLNGKF